MEREQTRREFCAQTCRIASVAALGAAVAAALQACGGGASGGLTSASGVDFSALPTVSGTGASGAITVNVASAPALADVGSMALVRSAIGDALVVRTAADSFAAFTSVCTHQGNEITGMSGRTFVCPAHGAQYDTSGRVVAGPARSSLRQYTTLFADGVLTIRA